MANKVTVPLRSSAAHPKQSAFIQSPAKRKIIRAGRRSGKTTGVAVLAVMQFLAGRRVLYATPTAEQIARFWSEVKMALDGVIRAGVFVKNETLHLIERPGTEQRIRAKTAWNADTLRGDYADLLILDEFYEPWYLEALLNISQSERRAVVPKRKNPAQAFVQKNGYKNRLRTNILGRHRALRRIVQLELFWAFLSERSLIFASCTGCHRILKGVDGLAE